MSRPLHGFMDVVHEMKRIQDRMYGEGTGTEDQQKQRSYADAWTPTTEVLSKGDDLLIRAELAGVNPDYIDLTFTEGTLTISGHRERLMGEEEEASYYVQERYYGYFRRSMTLPESVKDEDISAGFQDGVVEITVKGGATVPPEPKRIELKRTS